MARPFFQWIRPKICLYYYFPLLTHIQPNHKLLAQHSKYTIYPEYGHLFHSPPQRSLSHESLLLGFLDFWFAFYSLSALKRSTWSHHFTNSSRFPCKSDGLVLLDGHAEPNSLACRWGLICPFPFSPWSRRLPGSFVSQGSCSLSWDASSPRYFHANFRILLPCGLPLLPCLKVHLARYPLPSCFHYFSL